MGSFAWGTSHEQPRVFGIDPRTLEEWDQGRRNTGWNDQRLALIAKNGEAALKAPAS